MNLLLETFQGLHMEIARERFLDDTRRYHVTLSLRSRTNEMHSVLGALSPDERDAVGTALARALDEIQVVIGRRISETAPVQ